MWLLLSDHNSWNGTINLTRECDLEGHWVMDLMARRCVVMFSNFPIFYKVLFLGMMFRSLHKQLKFMIAMKFNSNC